MKFVVIPTAGPARVEDAKPEDLSFFQNAVGGYIEVVVLPRGDALMVVNEEGKLTHLPINRRATLLYPGDIIVGDVVIVGPPDEEGEFTAAPDYIVESVEQSARANIEEKH